MLFRPTEYYCSCHYEDKCFELVFGQHPRSVIFPGILTKKIQEDVEDILYESDNNDEEVQQYDAGYSNEERQQYDMWCNDEEQQQYGLEYDDEGKQQQYDMDNDERQQQYDMDSNDEGRQQNYDMDNDDGGRQQQHDMDNDDEVRQQKYDVECDDGKRQQYGTNSSNEDCYHQSLATTSKHILMRKKADICYCENAKRMQLKYTKAKRKKIMTFSVGDYVSVHIPRIDCSFTDSHLFLLLLWSVLVLSFTCINSVVLSVFLNKLMAKAILSCSKGC